MRLICGGRGEERDLWFIPTQEHPTLLVLLGAPSPPASPEYAAVLSPLSGPRVHPGSPARDPTHVSASSWGSKQASAQQKSPRDVARWAPVRSASSA